MKICLLLSVSLFWSVTSNALCQDVLGTTVIRHAPSVAPDHFRAFADSRAVECSSESDCQILWGTYSHGDLWENYCFEKRPSLTRGMCRAPRGREAVFELAQQCRTSCATPPDRRRATRPGRLQRERIICFDLFFELLGWNQCSCCVHSCQHRGSCGQHQPPQPVAPQPVAPAVPAESSEPTLAVPPPPAHDVPAAGKLDESPPVPAVTKPSTPPSETPAVEPVDTSRSTPPLDDPPPAVPRNAIPPSEPEKIEPAQSAPSTTGPSMSRATRRETVKILVAERLSDYIKTH